MRRYKVIHREIATGHEITRSVLWSDTELSTEFDIDNIRQDAAALNLELHFLRSPFRQKITDYILLCKQKLTPTWIDNNKINPSV